MNEQKNGGPRYIVPLLDPKSVENLPLILLACIDERWQKYMSAFRRFLEEPSGDAIRSVRVATRKLRSLLQVMDILQPFKPLNRLVRAYKKQLNDLDGLRDAQVQLGLIESELKRFPALEPFKEQLEKEAARQMKTAKKEFKQVVPGETVKAIVRWLERLDGETAADQPRRLMELIDEAFRITRERLSRVDPADPASIHRVRLAFKKFRYRIEVTQPLLRLFTPEALDCLRTYQGRMGAVQDLRILLAGLEGFTEAHPQAELQEASRYYQGCLVEAVKDFMAHKDLLNDFWRLEEGQPFPWRTLNENLPAQAWNCDGA